MATSTRDRLLDATEQVLVESGTNGLTLEAVAARAGTSKGGLLYHFPSKDALVVGLADRLAAAFEEELDEVARTGGSLVALSLVPPPLDAQERALQRTLLAVLRSSEGGRALHPAVQRIYDRWQDMLTEELGDPVLAETVRLVGDGLYLGALVGARPPDPARLREVAVLLLGDRAGRPAP
jgi:AcrR family transcriptional regulator